MNRIRVLVGDMSGLLAGIVSHLLESQGDIALVGRSDSGDALMAAARESRPDVVILGVTDTGLPPVGETLLREIPSVRVLGVTGDHRRGYLYVMRPSRLELGELSADGLVTAIRSAAGAGRH